MGASQWWVPALRHLIFDQDTEPRCSTCNNMTSLLFPIPKSQSLNSGCPSCRIEDVGSSYWQRTQSQMRKKAQEHLLAENRTWGWEREQRSSREGKSNWAQVSLTGSFIQKFHSAIMSIANTEISSCRAARPLPFTTVKTRKQTWPKPMPVQPNEAAVWPNAAKSWFPHPKELHRQLPPAITPKTHTTYLRAEGDTFMSSSKPMRFSLNWVMQVNTSSGPT